MSILAKEQVSIAINVIPGLLVEGNQQLAYSKVLTRLQEMSEFNLKIDFYPSSRAGKVFNDKKTHCLFPGSTKVQHGSGPVIQSEAVNTAHAFMFSREAFSLKTVLLNKRPRLRIAFRRGNTFGGTLNKLNGHSLVELNTDLQSFGLLKSGRVDLVLAYMPDVQSLVKQVDGTELFYDKENAFYSQNDSFICHKESKTSAFIEQLDKDILTLIESGELASMLDGN